MVRSEMDRNGREVTVKLFQTAHYNVRFQVLMAASMKIRAFWDVAPCSLVGIDRRFRGAYCLHHQDED
jgi:hypothetical protein